MLGFDRTSGFFESIPILEVDLGTVWSDGRVFTGSNIDIIDPTPALNRRGDSAGHTLNVSGAAGDPRWVLDYFWSVIGWDSGTSAAARNHSVFRAFASLDAGSEAQAVIVFPGPGPTIRYSPTLTDRIANASGSIRLRGRIINVSLTTVGTNVPSKFDFGAYLRPV